MQCSEGLGDRNHKTLPLGKYFVCWLGAERGEKTAFTLMQTILGNFGRLVFLDECSNEVEFIQSCFSATSFCCKKTGW